MSRSSITNIGPVPQAADVPTLEVPDVAAYLGISRSAAYAAVARGDLPSIRVGGRRVVVPTAALRRLLQLDEVA